MEETGDKDDYDLNKYTYFVTDSPLNEWNRLPDLTPESLNEAKSIKYIISGDINRRIVSIPT